MDGTWIHALLDLIVLGILAALILSRHLELKREQQRLLDELAGRTDDKHQRAIQFARENREWIAAELGREAGRLAERFGETLQQHAEALSEVRLATEQLNRSLAHQLSEASRKNLQKIDDAIHLSAAAQSQHLIEQMQACRSGLQTYVQTRLSEELAAMGDVLLHKMGEERRAAIDEVFDRLEALGKRDARFIDFIVDREGQTVTLSKAIRFDTGSHQLGREQAKLLRAYLMQILEIADCPQARKWLKRISATESGDGSGTYLFNLNLGLQRSQRILSVLLSPTEPGEKPLRSEELEVVQRLFAVNYHPAGPAKALPGGQGESALHFEFLTEALAAPKS